MINLQKKKNQRASILYTSVQLHFGAQEITDNALAVLIKKIYIPAREKEEREKMCHVTLWVTIKWLPRNHAGITIHV